MKPTLDLNDPLLIPSQKAAPGFDAAEWAYLEYGVVLQDQVARSSPPRVASSRRVRR
jgi:hypothetical protein